MLCSYYFGLLTSLFFVTKDVSKRNRYHFENPNKTSIVGKDYFYQGAHGLSSSILYYFLYTNGFGLVVIPALIVDLAIWGPYYSNGPLAGLAFGFIY